jgi:predicted transcriptional regulator
MGTLFNQDERHNYNITETGLEEVLKVAIELSRKYKCELKDVIALQHAMAVDRLADLQVDDGNRKDDQLAGFGELMKQLNTNVEAIAAAIFSNESR